MGRVSPKTDPTRLLISLFFFFFSSRLPTLSSSFFFLSLMSLSLTAFSPGSDQGHHGQDPCSFTGTMHRRAATSGGDFWFGKAEPCLSPSQLLFLLSPSRFFLFSPTRFGFSLTETPHGSLSL